MYVYVIRALSTRQRRWPIAPTRMNESFSTWPIVAPHV